MISSSGRHGLPHVSGAPYIPPPPRKERVTVKIFSGEPDYGLGIDAFIAFVEGLKAEIPESAVSTSVTLKSESDYGGGHYPVLIVSYDRMETDEEFAARIDRSKEASRRQEEAEIRQMEALMKKHLKAGEA